MTNLKSTTVRKWTKLRRLLFWEASDLCLIWSSKDNPFSYMYVCLTHWCLNEIACDPPLIPWHFLEYSRASESTKINHMHSNHRQKIGFQDVVYSKLNKWRVKIFKNIDKKTSTWCVKLIRKQKIILFLYCTTKCPTPRKLNMQKWVNYWLQRTKRNQIQQNFLSCTIWVDIWENNRK